MKYFRLWVFVFLTLQIITGCSLAKSRHHSENPSNNLFPSGTYRHNVTLTTSAFAQVYRFSGVLRLYTDYVQIAVLSQFGTTEFKIYENLKTGEIKTEIFRPEFKKFEPRLNEYYRVLRLVLLSKNKAHGDLLKWKSVNEKGYPLDIDALVDQNEVHFRLSAYDDNNIPGKFEISHPQFNVSVEVSGYEI